MKEEERIDRTVVVSIDGTPLTVVDIDRANKRKITKVAKQRFLLLLEEGYNAREAAHQLGLTGTKMRAEAKRDEEFGRQVEEAKLKARPMVADRIREAYMSRALDPDGPDRLLHNLAVVYLPEFEVFRRTKIEGDVGVRALPTIDASQYTTEELRQLRDLLSRGARPEIEQ